MKLSQRIISYGILAIFMSGLMIAPLQFVQKFWPVSTSFGSLFLKYGMMMNCTPNIYNGLNLYSAPVVILLFSIVLACLCALHFFLNRSEKGKL